MLMYKNMGFKTSELLIEYSFFFNAKYTLKMNSGKNFVNFLKIFFLLHQNLTLMGFSKFFLGLFCCVCMLWYILKYRDLSLCANQWIIIVYNCFCVYSENSLILILYTHILYKNITNNFNILLYIVIHIIYIYYIYFI